MVDSASSIPFVSQALIKPESTALLLSVLQRSGRRQELLRGPLLYGCAHVALTLAFWRQHPAGLLGVAALCAGRQTSTQHRFVLGPYFNGSGWLYSV
jgi:hypothetical protein